MRGAAILARLREPSTWAALAALGSIVGHGIPPDLTAAAPVLVSLGAAVLGVALPERQQP